MKRKSQFAVSLLVVMLVGVGLQPSAASILTVSIAGTSVSLEQEELRIGELLERYGDNHYLVNELGNISFRLGNVEKATRLWEQASVHPNLPGPEVQLIFADLAQNDVASAEQKLQQQDYKNSRDPHLLVAAGQLALLRREIPQAEEAFLAARELSPELPVVLVSLGNLHEFKGEQNEAMTLFKSAAEFDSKYTAPFLRMAMVHFRNGRIAEAAEALRGAENSDVRQPLAESRIGELLLRKGDYYQAQIYFNAALQRDPESHISRVLLGNVLQRVDREDEAIVEYNKVLEQASFIPAHKALAEIAYRKRNLDEAISRYRQVLTENPNDVVACNNLAMLIVERGEGQLAPDQATPGTVFEPGGSATETDHPSELSSDPANEALRLVERALIHAAQSPQLLAQLEGTHGCVLWFAGQHEHAETVLTRSIQGGGANQPWTRYCFAQLSKARGNNTRATENFEACLFLDQKFDRREEVLRELGAQTDPRTARYHVKN